MHAIKILIAEVPGLLGAMVCKTLNEEPDMEVVAKISSADDLAEALQRSVDVVVTASATTDLAPPFRALLFRPSPLPVLAISVDGKRIDVYGRSVTRGGGLDGLTGLIREAVIASRPRIGG